MQILSIKEIHILREGTYHSQEIFLGLLPIAVGRHVLVYHAFNLPIYVAERICARVAHKLRRNRRKNAKHFQQMVELEIMLSLCDFEDIVQDVVSQRSDLAIDKNHSGKVGILGSCTRLSAATVDKL